MKRIRTNVNAYLIENPDADMDEIRARFGEPREIAAAYVSDMDTAELLTVLRIRRRILAAVMAAVMFVVVSWGSCVLWAIDETKKSLGGHIENAFVEGGWQEGMEIDWIYE